MRRATALAPATSLTVLRAAGVLHFLVTYLSFWLCNIESALLLAFASAFLAMVCLSCFRACRHTGRKLTLSLPQLPLFSNWIVWVPAMIGLLLTEHYIQVRACRRARDCKRRSPAARAPGNVGRSSALGHHVCAEPHDLAPHSRELLLRGVRDHAASSGSRILGRASHSPSPHRLCSLSLVAGIYAFGASGFILGPLLVGTTVTTLDLYCKYKLLRSGEALEQAQSLAQASARAPAQAQAQPSAPPPLQGNGRALRPRPPQSAASPPAATPSAVPPSARQAHSETMRAGSAGKPGRITLQRTSSVLTPSALSPMGSHSRHKSVMPLRALGQGEGEGHGSHAAPRRALRSALDGRAAEAHPSGSATSEVPLLRSRRKLPKSRLRGQALTSLHEDQPAWTPQGSAQPYPGSSPDDSACTGGVAAQQPHSAASAAPVDEGAVQKVARRMSSALSVLMGRASVVMEELQPQHARSLTAAPSTTAPSWAAPHTSLSNQPRRSRSRTSVHSEQSGSEAELAEAGVGSS